jgi:hypothetical protein
MRFTGLQICQNIRNIFARSSNAKYAINVQNERCQRQYICESRLLGLSFTPTAAFFTEYQHCLQNEVLHVLEDILLKTQLPLFLQLEDFPTIAMH